MSNSISKFGMVDEVCHREGSPQFVSSLASRLVSPVRLLGNKMPNVICVLPKYISIAVASESCMYQYWFISRNTIPGVPVCTVNSFMYSTFTVSFSLIKKLPRCVHSLSDGQRQLLLKWMVFTKIILVSSFIMLDIINHLCTVFSLPTIQMFTS